MKCQIWFRCPICNGWFNGEEKVEMPDMASEITSCIGPIRLPLSIAAEDSDIFIPAYGGYPGSCLDCRGEKEIEDKEERLREKILRLSFDWQQLRDCADLLEYHSYDATRVRLKMLELSEEIRRLKDEMALEPDRLKVRSGEVE